MAASVVSGDAGVDGLTGEPVSRVTFRTGAAHLFSCLRTPGSFSTTAVPEQTHVFRYRETEISFYSSRNALHVNRKFNVAMETVS